MAHAQTHTHYKESKMNFSHTLPAENNPAAICQLLIPPNRITSTEDTMKNTSIGYEAVTLSTLVGQQLDAEATAKTYESIIARLKKRISILEDLNRLEATRVEEVEKLNESLKTLLKESS